MMGNLMRRGEALARTAQQRAIGAIADRLRAAGGLSVEAESGRVIIGARGLAKRWLSDPALRFLAGSVK
jgi:hypothetical protein